MRNVESRQRVSVTGEVWRLGTHRLVCGDCTDPAIVAKALAGATPNLMVTDPPYGVNYEPAWRAGVGALGPARSLATAKCLNDDRCDWRAALALFPGDVLYAWHASLRSAQASAAVRAAGFEPRSMIVWAKPHFAISRGHYHWQHESAIYAVRRGRTASWRGDRKQSTLWKIGVFGGWSAARASSWDARTAHSTQKPIECMRRPILNHTNPGDHVYDQFVGSGTTIMAAEATGRSALAIELSAEYCEIAIARWEKLTGGVAEREG